MPTDPPPPPRPPAAGCPQAARGRAGRPGRAGRRALAIAGGALLAPLLGAASARAEEALRHDQPERYVRVPPALAEPGRLASLAAQLRAEDPRRSLGQAARWIHRNVRARADAPAAFRTFDQILAERHHGGPADLSVLVGVFARGLGLPTLWVQAVRLDHLREAHAGARPPEAVEAAVFLEVHWGRAWKLLDPVGMRLWDGYDPAVALLPEGWFALGKGADPGALALPGTGPEWPASLRRAIERLDPARLPFGTVSDLLAPWRVYVAGAGFGAVYAKEATRATGYLTAEVFAGDWDASLNRARGATLLVMLDEERRPVLPERYWRAWLPPGHVEALRPGAAPAAGYLAHRLPDGTRVILVCPADSAETEAAVAAALEG